MLLLFIEYLTNNISEYLVHQHPPSLHPPSSQHSPPSATEAPSSYPRGPEGYICPWCHALQ